MPSPQPISPPRRVIPLLLLVGIVAIVLLASQLLILTSGMMPSLSTNRSTDSPSTVPISLPATAVSAKGSLCQLDNMLPDPICTPGAADPRVTQANLHSTICSSGYSASVRPAVSVTNKIKKERLQAYGLKGTMQEYELDHLISLELGGAPASVSNLWPEPYAGSDNAHDKDVVENYLHEQVCSDKMTLQATQTAISTNWIKVYDQIQAAKH